MNMTPLVWQYIGIFSTALAAILLGLLLWRRRELRRQRAIEVGNEIAPWGFEHLSRLCTAYAVGNYLGRDSVTRELHAIIDEVKAGGLPTMLKKVGWKVVKGVFLVNADDRKELRKLLDAADAVPTVNVVPPPPVA
jgi:ATP-dependent Zn protease